MTTQTPHIDSGRIPIFRAGTHTAADGRRVTISTADLQDMVDSYAPELQRAPHVVGHPELDAPAYGWVRGLSVDGDTLVAESEQVEAQFAAMVNGGRFPNRSASIYLPTTPGNPKPGRHYLKHVGWLGAAPPSVLGLSAVKFAADSGAALSFSFPIHKQKESTMDEATLKQRQEELDAREARVKADEAQVAQAQAGIQAQAAAASRADALQFAQALEKEGKLLPAEVAPVVELLLAQPQDSAPLSFSQAGTQVSKPAGAFLRELLKNIPTRIDYREKSGDVSTAAAAVSFAAPAGAQVDATRADLHARATQFQAKNPNVGWLDAVKAVGG